MALKKATTAVSNEQTLTNADKNEIRQTLNLIQEAPINGNSYVRKDAGWTITQKTVIDTAFSDTSTNPVENKVVSTLRRFTQKYNANLTEANVKSINNQHAVCQGDMNIEVGTLLQDDFNLLVTVEEGNTVTIVPNSTSTVNITNLTSGVYLISKFRGDVQYVVDVLERDFQTLAITGTTFDINTKSGKHFYESFATSSPYSSAPKSASQYDVNIGEAGSWGVINSKTTSEPNINILNFSLPVNLVGFTEFEADELSDKIIDIVIEVKPFAVQVSYRYISN